MLVHAKCEHGKYSCTALNVNRPCYLKLLVHAKCEHGKYSCTALNVNRPCYLCLSVTLYIRWLFWQARYCTGHRKVNILRHVFHINPRIIKVGCTSFEMCPFHHIKNLQVRQCNLHKIICIFSISRIDNCFNNISREVFHHYLL